MKQKQTLEVAAKLTFINWIQNQPDFYKLFLQFSQLRWLYFQTLSKHRYLETLV